MVFLLLMSHKHILVEVEQINAGYFLTHEIGLKMLMREEIIQVLRELKTLQKNLGLA